jgi:3-methyladenine DNA glycosylase AlkD
MGRQKYLVDINLSRTEDLGSASSLFIWDYGNQENNEEYDASKALEKLLTMTLMLLTRAIGWELREYAKKKRKTIRNIRLKNIKTLREWKFQRFRNIK